MTEAALAALKIAQEALDKGIDLKRLGVLIELKESGKIDVNKDDKASKAEAGAYLNQRLVYFKKEIADTEASSQKASLKFLEAAPMAGMVIEGYQNKMTSVQSAQNNLDAAFVDGDISLVENPRKVRIYESVQYAIKDYDINQDGFVDAKEFSAERLAKLIGDPTRPLDLPLRKESKEKQPQ